MRLAPTHLIAFYRDDGSTIPPVGSRYRPELTDLYGTLCNLIGVSFEVTIHSHFRGDDTSGFFGLIELQSLSLIDQTKCWHRGLFQLPSPSWSLPPQPAFQFPWNTLRQVQVVAFAASPETDMARAKQFWESKSSQAAISTSPSSSPQEQLLCVPLRGAEWSDWQPIDYALFWIEYCHERFGGAEGLEKSVLNPMAFLLIGEEKGESVEKDIVKVVVPWRQSSETLDPIRTFRATLEAARELVIAMGATRDAGKWRVEAESLLDAEPDAVAELV